MCIAITFPFSSFNGITGFPRCCLKTGGDCPSQDNPILTGGFAFK